MKKAGELYSLETSEEPWQEISINIIGPLPKSNRLDAIVVIVDWFMKMIRLQVTTTTVSLENIAKIHRDKIWKIYGILWKVLSDREPQFASKFIKDFTKTLGTKQTLFTAYHFQTNGQMEQINQGVIVFLWHYVNYQ